MIEWGDMSRDESQVHCIGFAMDVSVRKYSVAVLAVGEPTEWESHGNLLPSNGNLAFVSFGDVSRDLLAFYSPAAVYSPALGRSFDCIDLAVTLHELEYQGAYRATADGLPRPELIEREVLQICPELDFQIVNER